MCDITGGKYLIAGMSSCGLSWYLSGEESACNAEDPGLSTGLERSPGGGHVNPLQYPCLENLMDRWAWWATVHMFMQHLCYIIKFSIWNDHSNCVENELEAEKYKGRYQLVNYSLNSSGMMWWLCGLRKERWARRELWRFKICLVCVASWSSLFFSVLTSGNWMCLLVHGISWFVFKYYFSF